MEKLLGDPKVQKALNKSRVDAGWAVERQMELCAIRSPSNQESARAKRYLELYEEWLRPGFTDEVGNVFGVLEGTGQGPTLLLSGHMDTVFDINTTARRVRDGRIWAPGIADDTRGMVDVLTVAKAMIQNGIRPQGTIIFCGDVGRKRWVSYGACGIFLKPGMILTLWSIDGTGMGSITYNAVASYKCRMIFTGNGGHALSMFGYPNANNALARTVAKIADIQVPKSPITIFNAGILKGGTGISTIPTEAMALVDMRSLSKEELDRLYAKVEAAILADRDEENARWNHPTERVSVKYEVFSSRPGGEQSRDCDIVQAMAAACGAFGIEPNYSEAASTDANIPISLGIPAIAIGRSGMSGNTHTVNEWYDPTDAHIGMARDLVLALVLAGYKGVCEPVLTPRKR
jgi:acetylornithine deacetylase/succinyl-diaminopimelate desuccinylase-like protein